MVALVPLALGMTALASLLLGDYAQAQALAERAARVLPADVSDQFVQLVLRTKRDSPLLLAASLVAMVWASAGAVGVLERSMSRLLDRERFGPLVGKLRHLGLAAALTFVLVLVVLAASKATGLERRLGLEGALPRLGHLAGGARQHRARLRGAVPVVPARRYIVAGRARRRRPRRHGSAAHPERGGVLPRLGRRDDPGPFTCSWSSASVLFICYLAALALLLGAAVATRLALRAPPPG